MKKTNLKSVTIRIRLDDEPIGSHLRFDGLKGEIIKRKLTRQGYELDVKFSLESLFPLMIVDAPIFMASEEVQ